MKGKSKMRRTLKSFCASLVFLAVSSPAWAQGIESGSIEASGNFGYARVNGINSNNHFTFGPSVVYNLNQVVAVGGEYSYQNLGSETLSGVTGSGHLQTYGGVVRFSFSDSARAVPYALVGVGGTDLRAVASAGNISASAGQTGLYYAFGGGVSLFAGPRWGIRPEVRYSRQQYNATTIEGTPSAAFGQNDITATVAIFYQFGGRQSQKN
jgi:hypothetical protein